MSPNVEPEKEGQEPTKPFHEKWTNGREPSDGTPECASDLGIPAGGYLSETASVLETDAEFALADAPPYDVPGADLSDDATPFVLDPRPGFRPSAVLETDDQKTRARKRSRVFSFLQFADDLRGAPRYSQELLEEGLAALAPERWAYIWHDRDRYLGDDLDAEVAERLVGAHVHGVIWIPSRPTRRTVADALGLPSAMIRIPSEEQGKARRGRGAAEKAFYDLCQYLTHESGADSAVPGIHHPERSYVAGKYQYGRGRVVSNFDFSTDLDAGRPAEAKNQRKKLSDVDVLALKVQEEGLSLRAARKEDPLAYSRGLDRLRKARGTFLSHSAPPAVRTNYYLGGRSETGKTALARLFARMLYPSLPPEECYFEVGAEMVALQAYDGQPVVIWDDYRAVSLLHALKDRGTVWRVFDTSPGRAQVNIKNGAVGMVQAVNIVTGVAPYAQFLDALAGTYKGADGTEHQAEDSTQAWRRFPFVGEVTKEQILLYANQGYAGLGEYRDYQHIISTRANMRTVMRTIEAIEDPEAREQFRMELGDRMLGAMVAAHENARPQRTLTIEQARAALEGEVVSLSGDDLARAKADEQARRDAVIQHAAAMAAALDRARPESLHRMLIVAGDETFSVHADGRLRSADGVRFCSSSDSATGTPWAIKPSDAPDVVAVYEAAGLLPTPTA